MITFIGLDGGQGSGKTTYSHKLIPELQAQTNSPVLYIETDDFLTEREWREPLPEEFFLELASHRKLWDFARMSHILRELQASAGKHVNVDGLYNRKTGKRDRQTTFSVHDDSIVLVGGPYLLEPEFSNIFSRLIFLNVPEPTRKQRVIERNLANGGSKERALEVFGKFEHFYEPYWQGRLDRYDEVTNN